MSNNLANKRGPAKKAIFFDRDGTLIVDKIYLNDPDQIEYLPGVFTALKKFRDAGFIFFIATNQSGVPRGRVTIKNLNEIHRRMKAKFAEHGVDILEFYYAPYLTDHDHIFRKPNPGMLLQAAEEYNVDLGKSWMFGDRLTDVEAGRRAGARTIWLVNDTAEKFEADSSREDLSQPDGCFSSVEESVPFVLRVDQE